MSRACLLEELRNVNASLEAVPSDNISDRGQMGLHGSQLANEMHIDYIPGMYQIDLD